MGALFSNITRLTVRFEAQATILDRLGLLAAGCA